MKIITFSSIKGGTGKSSLCILTGNYLAAAGYRVLVIDLDVQNSTTNYYLEDPDTANRRNAAMALQTERLAENIVTTNYMGVDLLASSFSLVKLRAIGERTLVRILKAEPLSYDFVLIDSAPTYDNLVLNGIHAADLIVTPVAFSQFDLKGAAFFRDQLALETDKLANWRVLFNFYRQPRSDNPDTLRNQYESLFRETLGDAIAPVTIPESRLVRRSIDAGERITDSVTKATLHRAIGALAEFCGAERQVGRF